MAANKDIFFMYCDIAIAYLQQEGLIKNDSDWDRHGNEYTIRLYNQDGRNTRLVVIHDRSYKKITVIDATTGEEMEYDFIPGDRESRKRFAEVIIEFARKRT